jgi:hypothetical protein
MRHNKRKKASDWHFPVLLSGETVCCGPHAKFITTPSFSKSRGFPEKFFIVCIPEPEDAVLPAGCENPSMGVGREGEAEALTSRKFFFVDADTFVTGGRGDRV